MLRIGALLVVVLGLVVAMVSFDRADITHFLAGAPGQAPDPVPTGAVPAAPTERQLSLESDLYSFDYAYPAQAAAIPALGDLLERKIARGKATVAAEATQSRKDAKANGFPFQPHYFDLVWQASADLPGWLSLQAGI